MQFSSFLDVEQSAAKQSVSQFATEFLNPGIEQREQAGHFSRQAWDALCGYGLSGLILPKCFGGKEMKAFDAIAVLEGLGYGCLDNGLMSALHAHTWGCETAISHFGSDEQKENYLPGLAAGKLIGASAMTEPNAGSNIYALETTAEKMGNAYVLNGSKMFITNAPVADVFIIYARTDPNAGFGGMSAFIIEKKTHGLQVEENLAKMSLRTGPLSGLSLSECRIPEKNLLGRKNSGAMVFSDSIEWERTFVMTTALGAMERQLKECVEFINIRKADRQEKGCRQYLGNKTAEMKIRLESARMLIYRAAGMKQEGRIAYLEATMAKVAASEAFNNNCRDAVSIFSGGSIEQKTQADRDLRDAMATNVYSGSTDVLKDNISKLLD
jgi:alkylation response protein AidB-like acyl-CoA dehydrogenase